MVVSRKEVMSYEQRAHVIVLGATLERAVDKVHELVGTQGVESIVTQKHNHIVKTSNGFYPADELSDYLQTIKDRTQFSKWYFGHYHDDRSINDKEILYYEKINRIW